MAYELEKIESEFKKIWKAIEELQMTRQAKDEFRAEIWQAIEELKEKQDSLENGPKVSVLCRKCKAENMVYDFAQWEYTCRKCGFDHANEYNEDAPKEPDYRKLWVKLKQENKKRLEHWASKVCYSGQGTYYVEGLTDAYRFISEKMQELEAG